MQAHPVSPRGHTYTISCPTPRKYCSAGLTAAGSHYHQTNPPLPVPLSPPSPPRRPRAKFSDVSAVDLPARYLGGLRRCRRDWPSRVPRGAATAPRKPRGRLVANDRRACCCRDDGLHCSCGAAWGPGRRKKEDEMMEASSPLLGGAYIGWQLGASGACSEVPGLRSLSLSRLSCTALSALLSGDSTGPRRFYGSRVSLSICTKSVAV